MSNNRSRYVELHQSCGDMDDQRRTIKARNKCAMFFISFRNWKVRLRFWWRFVPDLRISTIKFWPAHPAIAQKCPQPGATRYEYNGDAKVRRMVNDQTFLLLTGLFWENELSWEPLLHSFLVVWVDTKTTFKSKDNGILQSAIATVNQGGQQKGWSAWHSCHSWPIAKGSWYQRKREWLEGLDALHDLGG